MNDLTYFLLADLHDGAGSPLVGWDSTFAIDRGGSPVETRAYVLTLVRDLLEGGLLAIGGYADGGEWQTWQGSNDALVERVSADYSPIGPTEVPDWNCYFISTPLGDQLFEAERARRRSEGLDTVADTEQIWGPDGATVESGGDRVRID